jgi:pSer/pThr/pTyr-binding forkhead associated (FHA) protein
MLAKELEQASHFGVLVTKRYTMTLDPRVSIGRSKRSDIVLSHPTVSSTHACLDSDLDDVYFVTDFGSTNGTTLNGVRIDPEKTVDCYPGDHIRFGDVDAVLCLLGTLRSVLVRARRAPPRL